MSGLLKHPALWPHLALNPEPNMDPEDPRRWFLELFGTSATYHLISCQSAERAKSNVHAYFKAKCAVRPASDMHPVPRRR